LRGERKSRCMSERSQRGPAVGSGVGVGGRRIGRGVSKVTLYRDYALETGSNHSAPKKEDTCLQVPSSYKTVSGEQ
jgi:hypothetical protein